MGVCSVFKCTGRSGVTVHKFLTLPKAAKKKSRNLCRVAVKFSPDAGKGHVVYEVLTQDPPVIPDYRRRDADVILPKRTHDTGRYVKKRVQWTEY